MQQHDPSLILITSNHWRHHQGAHALARSFNLIGIVSEERRLLQSGKTTEEDAIIKEYDQECAQKEKEYFGHATTFPLPEEKILHVAYGQGSSEQACNWMNALTPDYIVLFSAGIIREPLLSMYKGRIINLHLGLTPYYRGSANAFWPLVYGEPEGLGATVHLVAPEIDAGSILGQCRPHDLKENDGPRDVSNKNVLSGIDLFVRCIKEYAEGTITPVPQRMDMGRVFRHKDYSARAITALKDNFSCGMMRTYLEHKAERDLKYPIIER